MAKRSRPIHPVLVLFITVVIFMGIVGLMHLPLIGADIHWDGAWYLGDGENRRPISIPLEYPIYDAGSMVLSSTLSATENQALCLVHWDATALVVELDGQVLREVGTLENPTANFWNAMLVIPLPDSRDDNRTLRFTMSSTHQVTIRSQPFLEDRYRAIQRSALYNLVNSEALIFFMGGSTVLGLLLIGFSGQGRKRRWSYLLLGLASVLSAFYAFDYTYRVHTLSLGFYSILKRFVIASGYLATFAFLLSVEYHRFKRIRIGIYASIPTGITIMMMAVAPNMGVLFQCLPAMNGVLVLNLIGVCVLLYREMNDRPLMMVAAGLILGSLIQITVLLIFPWNIPPGVQFVGLVVPILFGLQLLLDLRRVFLERERLEEAYDRDPLTRSYNRRILEKTDLSNYAFAVFLDFDAFKYYNDKYGHDKGDELLIEFVRLARAALRRDDLIIRYGGDEFLLLLTPTREHSAIAAVDRLRHDFREFIQDPRVDISYGTMEMPSSEELDIGELDRRMYTMKKAKGQSL